MHDNHWNASLRFILAQVLTGSRIALAAAAVLFAVVQQSSLAAKLIVLGTVTDILDGPVAAMLRARSEFGEIFDYFADYLCYIVAPVVLTCTLLTGKTVGYTTLLLSFPLMTGAIRYSRNACLLKKEEFEQVGFPGFLTSCYALFVVSAVLMQFQALPGFPSLKVVFCIAVPIMSLLMISRIRYPKLTVSKAVAVLVVLFLLALPLVFTRVLAAFMLSVVLAYAIISPFLLRRREHNSTLQKSTYSPGDLLRR